jgi:hypothetical protein
MKIVEFLLGYIEYMGCIAYKLSQNLGKIAQFILTRVRLHA